MNGTIMWAALTVTFAVVGTSAWRRGRRVTGALFAGAAGCGALIAVRDLPQPMVVGLLLAALGVVAVVTVWPLLPGRVRRGRRRAGARYGRGSRR